MEWARCKDTRTTTLLESRPPAVLGSDRTVVGKRECSRGEGEYGVMRLTQDCNRFVSTSIPEVKAAQAKQDQDADKEMENLNKKLHYLETTNKNANEHLERILKGGGS